MIDIVPYVLRRYRVLVHACRLEEEKDLCLQDCLVHVSHSNNDSPCLNQVSSLQKVQGGRMSGITAATATYPLDLIRTRLAAQVMESGFFIGNREAVQLENLEIYQQWWKSGRDEKRNSRA
ncbi:mitochondrial substrate carrier family protein B [Tanacetum coccineum]